MRKNVLLLLLLLLLLFAKILLLLLLLLLLFVISFMNGIYNYIPQRKYISRVTYSFAGVLYLQINASCIIIIIIINIIL